MNNNTTTDPTTLCGHDKHMHELMYGKEETLAELEELNLVGDIKFVDPAFEQPHDMLYGFGVPVDPDDIPPGIEADQEVWDFPHPLTDDDLGELDATKACGFGEEGCTSCQ